MIIHDEPRHVWRGCPRPRTPAQFPSLGQHDLRVAGFVAVLDHRNSRREEILSSTKQGLGVRETRDIKNRVQARKGDHWKIDCIIRPGPSLSDSSLRISR